MRGKQVIGAGVAALALLSGGGWSAQAATGQAAAAKTPPPAPAMHGYQIVRLPNANVPNFQRRTVSCPAGKRVVGGGAEAKGNHAILVGSFPTGDGTGWIGLGRQDGYSTVGISVYAICASPEQQRQTNGFPGTIIVLPPQKVVDEYAQPMTPNTHPQVIRTYHPGARVTVLCSQQVNMGSWTAGWYRLDEGGYVGSNNVYGVDRRQVPACSK
ncbi:hypothetical protein ACFV2N_47715 [Streptomyces sp. NPDC059680]|uniref:hypothetical protein n=1 Tax=Streptomyces sp. NPDC059680 TaxID=3346904 RepID=UPI0036A72CD1